MLRKITKVKLHDDDTVEVIYKEILDDSGIKDAVNRDGGRKAHPDLIEAFKSLDIHFATLCEQYEYTDLEDDSTKQEKFHTTQFSIGGDGDSEGVTLTGHRRLVNNKILNLNAPFVKFKDSDYIYMNTLDMLIKNLLLETDQYLNGTKVAPTQQLDLFPKEGSESDESGEETSEEESSKKTKKGKTRSLKLSKEHPLMTGVEADQREEEEVSLQSK